MEDTYLAYIAASSNKKVKLQSLWLTLEWVTFPESGCNAGGKLSCSPLEKRQMNEWHGGQIKVWRLKWQNAPDCATKVRVAQKTQIWV